MIIDCHGHFTTVPASFRDWRAKQVLFANDPDKAPSRDGAFVSDDQIREAIGNGQLKLQRERGSDLTLFSPIAGLMSHHLGNERTSLEWAEVSNDLVYRVTELYLQFPQFPSLQQIPPSPLPVIFMSDSNAASLARGRPPETPRLALPFPAELQKIQAPPPPPTYTRGGGARHTAKSAIESRFCVGTPVRPSSILSPSHRQSGPGHPARHPRRLIQARRGC